MAIANMQELFLHELAEIYDAEHTIVFGLQEIDQGAAKELQKGLGEAHQSPELVDSVIISAAIKVEHFEIASYRTLITGAQQMGQQEEVVNLLNQNLQEEEQTAQIAEQSAPDLIQKAMMGQQGQQQEEDKGLIDKAKDKLMGQ